MAEQRKTKKSEPVDWLREALILTKYFDFYGEMFDAHQKTIFLDYVCNDMSLAEIAEREGMTRQGVSDTVKRISTKLHEYEDKLHLAEKAEKMEAILKQFEEAFAKESERELSYESMRNLCEQLKMIL